METLEATKYNLFLDDIRTPKNGDWTIARSFAEAVSIVEKHGYPAHVSFDHDLGDNVPTGMDFAKWLVEQDLDNQNMPEDFDYTVHSANPPGRENIKGLMHGYLKSKGITEETELDEGINDPGIFKAIFTAGGDNCVSTYPGSSG